MSDELREKIRFQKRTRSSTRRCCWSSSSHTPYACLFRVSMKHSSVSTPREQVSKASSRNAKLGRACLGIFVRPSFVIFQVQRPTPPPYRMLDLFTSFKSCVLVVSFAFTAPLSFTLELIFRPLVLPVCIVLLTWRGAPPQNENRNSWKPQIVWRGC